jgi:hypothetical protein
MKVLISLFCTIGFLLSNAQSISVQPAEKVYISTDRYYYKPGEKIYYSVFVASDSSLENKFTKSVRVWLVDPSGRDLDSGTFTFQNQENASFFYLPQTGGIYSIRAVSVQQMNQKHPNYFTKEIYVQSFVKKSFFIELKKDKNNYSYTDTLGGLLSFLSSGNMKLNRLPYKIHLLQAGERIWTEEGMSSAQGDSRIAVPLAGGLNSEEPLFIYIETSFKGILYSHMEKVPMNDKQIVLTVFFESGLDGYVPGSTNKLVLKSTDMLGNDLDIAAELRDNTGRLICNIKSVHKGLAPFQFVPESNMTYKIVARNNREIQLLPSKETIGFQIDFLETGFQRVNLNRDPDRDMVLVWSGKGKIL